MKGHLTEQELIEYRFKLASDSRVEKIAGHLEDCAQCRRHLEQLERKFAALDLLREEVEVSEDLISRVVKQAGQPVRTRVIPFRKPVWLSAAAVLLVGFILLATNLTDDGTRELEDIKGLSDLVEKKTELDQITDISHSAVSDERVSVASKPSLRVAKFGTEVTEPLSIVAGDKYVEEQISERPPLALAPLGKRTKAKMDFEYASASRLEDEAIPEQPPFAPASAIELVVLPRRDKVQLTIYNSADLTLVRERRNLTLKKGWNWLQFMWANTLIDPTSLSLEPLAQADKIDIQQLVFPARLRELGRWLIRSEVGGQVPFEITYFTSGLNWRAFYMGTLTEDEKTMQLQGYVRVGNNSGEDYEKAQTRLIVGKVHILDQIAELAKRKYAYDRPGIRLEDESGRATWDMKITNGLNLSYHFAGFAADAFGELRRKEIRKEGLSEYFLYTIEGTETIADKWGKRLLSFEAEDIKVKSLYKYDEERWGQQAIRFVAFTNDEEHNLGETPIPNGNVKIYNQADEQGYLSYVGGTSVKYIPVNEEVELNLGPARLVSFEPILMDFKTDNYVYDRKKNISGWDEIRTWKIKITNTRNLPIEIEITRGFGTAYWTLQTDIPYEKHDAAHARFKINLEPRSKDAFEYTVTTYHGVREESLAKIKK